MPESPKSRPEPPVVQHAASDLFSQVYEELKRLAAAKLANERSGQTLQPTALVHEAFLRLNSGSSPDSWKNERHFLAAAAEAMRRILIDNARRRGAIRHGGNRRRAELSDLNMPMVEGAPIDLLELDDVLDRLEAQSPRSAEIVKLRFFAGFSMPEIAEILTTSLSSVERQWVFARTWLYAALEDRRSDDSTA